MDYQALAERLFPEITTTPEDMEKRYPPRNLKDGAKVTRIAPSPTGFMHLGNLFGAMVDERLAHQSEGVFYLRIEDTDQKRLVQDGVKTILTVFKRFGLSFDEGATLEGDNGLYGPYTQSKRGPIYKTYVKALIAQGKAYPCFMTEEDLAEMHRLQEERKENFGCYGKYALSRNLTMEEIEKNLAEGKPYVIRFRSEGSIEHKLKFTDLVKGEMEITENDQDVVILKSDGLPTYHFAHVIDDHLMGTTHVVRGEEWLSTLPIHLQLFDALGFKRPKFVHTAQLMKMDGSSKRKLSKRKDPEFALDYYFETGIPIQGAIEYVMTLLNSNFEEWRRANPNEDMDKFQFTTKKMSGSGALFDLDKLNDVCKNVIARMSAEEVYRETADWAKDYDPEFYALFTKDPEYSKAILNIGRGGKKPRKDLARYNEVKGYVNFFFDELFDPDYTKMPNLPKDLMAKILSDYANEKESWESKEDAGSWFDEVKTRAVRYGFATDMKAYKQDPTAFTGSVADLSMVLRVAVCGRDQAPDLFTSMKLLGASKVVERLMRAASCLKEA